MTKLRAVMAFSLSFLGTLSACDCGVEPLTEVKDLPPGPVTPTVGELGTVKGRVCAPDGQTWLGGASVYVLLPLPAPGQPDRVQTFSDAEGFFTLEGVPAGTQTLHIERGSFAGERVVTVQSGLVTTIPDDACALENGPRIAIVHGSEFDDVEGVLFELGVQAETIDVFEDDWAQRLLGDEFGLDQYDILFLNCRSEERDLEASEEMRERLRSFVSRGGSLHASDQAYDLIEMTFPDKINFLGEDGERGAADEGKSVDALPAEILDDGLRNALGSSSVALHYGLDTWSVMVGVENDDVHVYMLADAPLRNGDVVLDAPQIVGFDHGDGRVVYSSFHQEPGIGVEQENVLKLIMFEL